MTVEAPRLADRMRTVGMSPTMKGTAIAEKMRREGIAVIDLGAGEPDFFPPAHVIAAAHAAIDAGRSKYTNWGRLMASLSDLLGVMWLKSRARRPGGVSEF